MNMKTSVFALLMATAMASATAVADNQKTIDAKADSALAKRGVEIGGSIRAVAQRSSFDTDQDPSGLNKMPDVERNEFVSANGLMSKVILEIPSTGWLVISVSSILP